MCHVETRGENSRIHILMSSQFVDEVFKVLYEGDDYDVVLLVKADGKVYRFKRIFSYDVVNRVFTIKAGEHEEKIRDPVIFKNRARMFSVDVPSVLEGIKVMIEHRGISLPFPFSIFYSSGYKTDWYKCK